MVMARREVLVQLEDDLVEELDQIAEDHGTTALNCSAAALEQ